VVCHLSACCFLPRRVRKIFSMDGLCQSTTAPCCCSSSFESFYFVSLSFLTGPFVRFYVVLSRQMDCLRSFERFGVVVLNFLKCVFCRFRLYGWSCFFHSELVGEPLLHHLFAAAFSLQWRRRHRQRSFAAPSFPRTISVP
jgi:hypothetical protein